MGAWKPKGLNRFLFGKVEVITSKILRSPPWLGWPLWNICVPNNHGCVPLVVITSRSFPYSCLVTGFITRLTRRVPLVEQELLNLPEHLSSTPVLIMIRVTGSLVLCVCFVDRCLSFFFWPLCCLFFFDLLILIPPLVSPSSSNLIENLAWNAWMMGLVISRKKNIHNTCKLIVILWNNQHKVLYRNNIINKTKNKNNKQKM